MYAQEDRLAAMKLRAEGTPIRAISTQLNVSKSVVHNWTRPPTPNMENHTVPQYDIDTKRRALELRAQGQTTRAIAKTLGIPEHNVYRWAAQGRDRAIQVVAQCQEDLSRMSADMDNPDLRDTLKALARRLARAKIGLTL